MGARRTASGAVAVLVAGALSVATCGGCSVSAKRTILAEALDERDERKEYFKAMLRILDEHPGYVDEFFAQALNHEPTMDRFLENAAQRLSQEQFAAMTAAHLVAHPKGLSQILIESLQASRDNPKAQQAIGEAIGAEVEMSAEVMVESPDVLYQVLVTTLEAAKDDPEAREVIAKALGEKVDIATGIITDYPEVVKKTLVATVNHVATKDEARLAFVRAMYGVSPIVADILASYPNVLTKLFRELMAQLSNNPEVMKQVVMEMLELAGDNKDERQPTSGQ